MIQDEQALLEPIDYEVMARIYKWQAMALDLDMDPQYRAHYKRRILAVREELNAIIMEIDLAERADQKRNGKNVAVGPDRDPQESPQEQSWQEAL